MISRRNDGGENKTVTQGVTSFKAGMTLNDTRLLDVVPEPWWTVAVRKLCSTTTAAATPR